MPLNILCCDWMGAVAMLMHRRVIAPCHGQSRLDLRVLMSIDQHDITRMTQGHAVQMRAKDYNYNWMTAAAMLDEDHYIGAENSHNIFVCRKNNDAAVDEARTSLEVGSGTLRVLWPGLSLVCCGSAPAGA